MKLNLDYLLERTWQELSLLRIYTKKPGRAPDFGDPIILRGGASVEHVCHSIHRSIVAVFKYALVWVSEGLAAVGVVLIKCLAKLCVMMVFTLAALTESHVSFTFKKFSKQHSFNINIYPFLGILNV